MVLIPAIFLDEKYKKWIIRDNPHEIFVLKPDAPQELQEALRKFKIAVSREDRVIDTRKQPEDWEEMDDWMDE